VIQLLPILAATLRQGTPGVLVTVVETRGSTPREAGTVMWVTGNRVHGTIGGGQLEYSAIEQARAVCARVAAGPSVERYPLGARVGQCCGGVVYLAFERGDTDCLNWVARATDLARQGRPWVRVAPLGQPCSASRIVTMARDGVLPAGLFPGVEALLAAAAPGARREPGALLVSSIPPELHVALFGAGHVGRAMAEVFARLPLQLTWFDSRREEFLPELPANAAAVCSDAMPEEVARLAAGTVYLVLTHSHALDFALICRILDRGDARFIGLIGSRAKRYNFARRLRERGYTPAQITSVTCPIGVAAVGKEPEVIAVSVAAQLMALRRSASRTRYPVAVLEQAGAMNAADCRGCSQPCVRSPEEQSLISVGGH
jgi:xanthine dehydrogenase accessory factor